MGKVVVNAEVGSVFSLSEIAWQMLAAIKGLRFSHCDPGGLCCYLSEGEGEPERPFYCREMDRSDDALVRTVERLGTLANAGHTNLRIVAVPDNVDWEVRSVHGYEYVTDGKKIWT